MKTTLLFLSVFLSVSLFGQFTQEQPLCDEIYGYKINTGDTQSCDSIIPTSYTGIVKRCVVDEYLSKDSIVREYTTYKNGIKHGVSRYWTDEGHFLYLEEYFDNGVLNGVRKVWRDADSNNLRYLENYKNGKRHGKRFTWNWDGILISEYNYKDDELDGVQSSWYNNGQLQSESIYKEGESISSKNWYDTGQLEKIIFKEGKTISKEWYKSGQIRKQIDSPGGLKNYKCWDEKGNVKDCFKRVATDAFD